MTHLRDLENNNAKMEDNLEDHQVPFEIQLVPSGQSALQPRKEKPDKSLPHNLL